MTAERSVAQDRGELGESVFCSRRELGGLGEGDEIGARVGGPAG